MKIARVSTYPLTCEIGDPQGTSQENWRIVSNLLVKIETDEGLLGWGEALARCAPAAYARLIDDLLAPCILHADPFAVEAIWQSLYRAFSGRSGGMLIEAIAAIDIALWDIMGKATGEPIHRLLGHSGRSRVAAYASSIGWNDDATAEDQTRKCLEWGFREIKVKLGAPLSKAKVRAKLIRELAGPDIRLMVDANWVFDVADALSLARTLADLDYSFFEEPIVPEDLEGYRRLAMQSPIRLAAGESEHTAVGIAPLIASRAIGVMQPDVARSGGFTETRRMIALSHAFHVAYAPHVGFSGAICAAASLHLAAAAPNFDSYECMIFANPLRDAVIKSPVARRDGLVEGELPVPQGPGLGIEIDEDALAEFLAR